MTSEYKQIVAQARKKKEKETASTEQQLVANQVASQVAGRSVQQKQYQQTAAQQAGTTEQPAGSTGWKYDFENDPAWNAYKKAYREEGRRAAADALAVASAATGGVPSSYALTAAQQARNNYAGKLTEILPTLEQTAYQRYVTEKADAYTREQDAMDRETAARTEAYNKALTRLELLGYADAETAQLLGLPEGYKLPVESGITWENSGLTDGNGNVIYYGSDGSERVFAPGYAPGGTGAVSGGPTGDEDDLPEDASRNAKYYISHMERDLADGRYGSTKEAQDRTMTQQINALYGAGKLSAAEVNYIMNQFDLWYVVNG